MIFALPLIKLFKSDFTFNQVLNLGHEVVNNVVGDELDARSTSLCHCLEVQAAKVTHTMCGSGR